MIEKKTLVQMPTLSKRNLTLNNFKYKIQNFPWWLVLIGFLILATIRLVASNQKYSDAFTFIKAGVTVTIITTLISYTIAILIGLFTSLGRISNNVVLKNLSTFYVEVIRGIPMMVLIFFIAFVGVPTLLDAFAKLGVGLTNLGLVDIGTKLSSIRSDAISMSVRAIVALAVTYGAYSSEIFRAGIQSIDKGQMEAARSQGMSYQQAMRYIILPQAIRNVLPALGNDFISMLKDTSLVSVLAVRDITQIAKLYAGRTFQFRESYLTLSVLYLAMTILLSFLVKYLEKRFQTNAHK